MNKNIKILFLAAFVFFGVFAVVGTSFAATDWTYTLLEKIPGFETISGDQFNEYIGGIYKFAIWTVGIAATLMLGIGGFMYFTSAGNTSHLEKAKTVIKDSIIGVVMALSAYLLLLVINPDLVGGNISSSQSTSIQSSDSVSTYDVPSNPTWPPDPANGTLPAGSLTHNDIAGPPVIPGAITRLAAAGPGVITVNGPLCAALLQTPCVSLDGIPESVVAGLERAAQAGFNITVTGGTEYWNHFDVGGTGLHGPGKPGIDINIPLCPPPPPPPASPYFCGNSEETTATIMGVTGASDVFCGQGGTEPVSCFVIGADRLHLGFGGSQ